MNLCFHSSFVTVFININLLYIIVKNYIKNSALKKEIVMIIIVSSYVEDECFHILPTICKLHGHIA